MKIVLAGGGTGGSVVPLLAVAEEMRKRNKMVEFLFIGTRKGKVEKNLINLSGMEYKSIFSGKLRRYFSLQNFFDPFRIILGFFESLLILAKYRPDVIFSAGSFVAVPVVWAGFFLGIKSVIHQQDIIPSLSNKLVASAAKKITVSFSGSLINFPKNKTVLTGNPVREEIFTGNKQRALKKFNLQAGLPVILIICGGTGSRKINNLIFPIVSQLSKFCQIIHLTGGKINNQKIANNCYRQYEFLTADLADAYAASDLIVSRAGLGVLTELVALAKPAIIIPLARTHQEANARYLAAKKAIICLNEEELDSKILLESMKRILTSPRILQSLSHNISDFHHPDSARKIADILSC